MFEESSEEEDVLIEFPVEFTVSGTPVSFQSGNPKSKKAWKKKVLDGARHFVPEHKWASDENLSITIYDFPEEPTQGDVDNVVKLIQDALCPCVVQDDSQITRVVAQRFLPGDLDRMEAQLGDLPDLVSKAMALADPPFVFVRLSSNPLGEAQ